MSIGVNCHLLEKNTKLKYKQCSVAKSLPTALQRAWGLRVQIHVYANRIGPCSEGGKLDWQGESLLHIFSGERFTHLFTEGQHTAAADGARKSFAARRYLKNRTVAYRRGRRGVRPTPEADVGYPLPFNGPGSAILTQPNPSLPHPSPSVAAPLSLERVAWSLLSTCSPHLQSP